MKVQRFGLLKKLNQQKIVLLIGATMFMGFSASLDGFANPSNLLALLQNVSIVGILALGMAITIIGRGIDLSMISVMAMPVAWAFVQISSGSSVEVAFLSAYAVALIVGLFNGWIVAYVEVPAIFATLATGTIVYGATQFFAVQDDIVKLPPALESLASVFGGTTYGVPHSAALFLLIAAIVAVFLRFTVAGRFIYAIGDNPLAARTSGVPSRPITVLQYVLSSMIALTAGFILAMNVDSANTRMFSSTLIYDVILVVVLGGIGLGGGTGRVSNVLVGTLMIGILLNGMTIMDVTYTTQNLIKASILLIAIVIDSLVNPRDEQTSQQGDI